MKWKKAIAGLITVTLMVSALTGCSTPTKKEKNTNVAMGRYVEQAIKMPEAVAAQKEYAYILIKNPQGQLELYASPAKSNNGEYTIQYTLTSDNTWNRTVPKWLNVKGWDVICVTYAPDGTKYAILSVNKSKEKMLVKILKSSDNETSTTLPFKQFKNAIPFYEAPYTMDILKDNTILLGCPGAISAYKDETKAFSFKTGELNYAISGNEMLGMNQKSDGAVKIDLTTGKTESNISLGNSTNPIFTADEKGNWYQLSNLGIQRMTKGGSTWEIILDANMSSICMPSLLPAALIRGNKDDFYTMFESGNGIRTIFHYVYDKNIPTAPDKTLSIVSLNNNDTVRQAIAGFQNKHQDVKVEYKVLKSEDDSTTDSDQIKTINTELLAGKGADILVLDGLPVKSYIEKGVLADISSTINPLIDSKEVLGNIMNNYKSKDGKIYYAPLRCSIAFAFGNKDAVAAAGSIDTLAEYAKTSHIPLISTYTISYSSLTGMLFRYYSNSFLTEQGFDRNGLINFLKQLKVISDQISATDQEPTNSVINKNQMESLMSMSQDYYDKLSMLGLSDLSSMLGVFAPIGVVDRKGGSYSCINKEYSASGYMGINNASSQKELASEFIQALLAEDVQKNALGDGFPVNTKALENYELAPDDYCISFDDIEITQPSVDKMKTILGMCKTLTTPVNEDQELLTMIKEEVTPYLMGKADCNSTADNIIARTKTFLSE